MRFKLWQGTVIMAAAIALLVFGFAKNQGTPIGTPTPQPPPAEPAPTPERTEDLDKLLLSKEAFSFKIFQEAVKQDSDKNIFISPFSIDMALLMAYNGAREETEQAMASTLEISGQEKDAINTQTAILSAFLESIDPKVQLSIANSFWMHERIAFKETFKETAEEFYGAEIRTLDFGDPASLSIINGWVREKTEGKIDEIIKKTEGIAFIINAIYFKGSWTDEFDESETTERPFTLLDGTERDHPLMSRFGGYAYFENEEFQAISIPYGDERLSMYVFLPREDVGLPIFFQDLTHENWTEWMSEFREMEGTIVLPRFTSEYDISLIPALRALGMGVAFSPSQADFRDLAETDENIYIEKVLHKTFVKVNEEGTEAAAVTVIGFATESVAPTFSMIVNRPFFYAIRDNELGTILFMGSMVDPED